MSITRHTGRSVALALVVALLSGGFATTALAMPSPARRPSATPSDRQRPLASDEALEYVSLGIAVAHAAGEQRAHAPTPRSAGSARPLTLAAPATAPDRTSRATTEFLVTAAIAVTTLVAIAMPRIRIHRSPARRARGDAHSVSRTPVDFSMDRPVRAQAPDRYDRTAEGTPRHRARIRADRR